jgi:uncharacterized membrane protein YedE/YeeE
MDFSAVLEWMDEAQLAAVFGLLTGLVFGIAAHRSSFCLRASAVEFARRQLGPRMAVWLLAFSTALVWVQSAELLGLFRSSDARMLAVAGSWSGAIIGGLMVGIGMVLSRGCPGRLLVLASTGNLRSVISGLIFAVVAQMSLFGLLAPVRDWLARLWVTPGGVNISLIHDFGLPQISGLLLGLAFAAVALWLARKNGIGAGVLVFASGVGFAVALGWVLTWSLSQQAFEPVTVTSATFSGPSANTLMFFLVPAPELGFDVGLVPGVFLGAFLSAALAHELRFEGFDGAAAMRRSIAGAILMGFGAMLAGGCSIGAGVTGGSIFVATAWLALLFMWIGAILADYLVDQAPARRQGA